MQTSSKQKKIYPVDLSKIETDTVKLGDKERFDKEQIVLRNHLTKFHPFYCIETHSGKDTYAN